MADTWEAQRRLLERMAADEWTSVLTPKEQEAMRESLVLVQKCGEALVNLAASNRELLAGRLRAEKLAQDFSALAEQFYAAWQAYVEAEPIRGLFTRLDAARRRWASLRKNTPNWSLRTTLSRYERLRQRSVRPWRRRR